jgi:hypothetical protein
MRHSRCLTPFALYSTKTEEKIGVYCSYNVPTVCIRLQVIAQLRGDKPLPWTEGCMNPEIHTRMGAMYGPLMQLLDRRPAQRPSAAQLRNQCMATAASAMTVVLNEIRDVPEIEGASAVISASDSLHL